LGGKPQKKLAVGEGVNRKPYAGTTGGQGAGAASGGRGGRGELGRLKKLCGGKRSPDKNQQIEGGKGLQARVMRSPWGAVPLKGGP